MVRAMQTFRRVTVILALSAMALRALIPAGWMPNPHGISETAFILCGGDGPHMPGTDMPGMDMSSSADSDSGQQAPARHSDDGHQHDACQFAAAAYLAAPLLAGMLQPPALAEKGEHQLFRARFVFGITEYANQSPRAPPRLA
jgi:hypothetical protein